MIQNAFQAVTTLDELSLINFLEGKTNTLFLPNLKGEIECVYDDNAIYAHIHPFELFEKASAVYIPHCTGFKGTNKGYFYTSGISVLYLQDCSYISWWGSESRLMSISDWNIFKKTSILFLMSSTLCDFSALSYRINWSTPLLSIYVPSSLLQEYTDCYSIHHSAVSFYDYDEEVALSWFSMLSMS